jgi:hypothetical protein
MHPRIEALKKYARWAVQNRRRELAAEEKRITEPTPLIRRALDERQHVIDLAEERLALYVPIVGKEHCPDCFAFDGKIEPLSFYRYGAPTQPLTAFCICGFRQFIPALE